MEKKVGWETLLNRAGTTFRKLPDKDKAGLNAKKAMALMLAQPSMIKRPVLELGGGKMLGRVRAGTLCQIGEQKRVALNLRAVAVARMATVRGKNRGARNRRIPQFLSAKVTATFLPPNDHALPGNVRLFLPRGGGQNLARSSGTEFAT